MVYVTSTSVVVPTVFGGLVTVVSPPPPQLPPGHDVTVTVDVVYVVS